jgi:hypothetical protein
MNNKRQSERGSVLVLSLICVLILSFLVEGILDVSQTEMYTTQNYQLSRMAFYKALEGIEDVREQIASVTDPELIETDVYRIAADTVKKEGGLTYSYITGDLVDFENDTYTTIRQFTGFYPPPPPSISPNAKFVAVVWEVPICAMIETNTTFSFGGKSKKIYSEVLTGAYQLISTIGGERDD